jgi:polyhydroxyalkanoate synthase subunit PhaC
MADGRCVDMTTMTQQEKNEVLFHLEQFGARFNQVTQDVIRRLLNQSLSPDFGAYFSHHAVSQTISSMAKIDARSFVQKQMEFLEKQQQLWQNTARAFMGELPDALVQEVPGDKRFSDADWQGNPAFYYIKQAYLLNTEYIQQMVDSLSFDDEKMGDQLRFYTRQLINSMAPTNFVFTNPEVCREILSTQGECLAKGLDKFLRDLDNSPAEAFKITQVNIDAFRLGENLAMTQGKVVYRNSLMELLHYSATTDQQYAIPLIIIPPFINKYYILDLDHKKSMVRWLLAQGFDVFMVSWVNPDETYCDYGFDRYVLDGVIAAMNVVEKITQSSKINLAGYCVGGTLLAMAQAYLAAKDDDRIESISLLTTLLDFSEPGEVGNYMNASMLPMIEQSVKTKGYLDGRILGLGFSLLRENHLFWTFFVENYLKGRDPVPFDILYWNSDSTNFPATAYLYYLNKMYIENELKTPGALTIEGIPIDLHKIAVATYCLAAHADHIVLWQAAYRSAQLLNSPVRFVLAESGHVAGVVNPAETGKYGYYVAEALATNPDKWFESAKKCNTSWWHDWHLWLQQRSGERVAAKPTDTHEFPALADAPGNYVKMRLEITQPESIY